MADGFWKQKLGTSAFGAAPGGADPTLTAQAQEWVRNRAQARAMGAVPTSTPTTVSPAVSAPTRGAFGVLSRFAAPAVEAGRVVSSALDPAQSWGETGLRALMGAGRVAGMGAGAALGSPLGIPGAIAGGTAGYFLPDIAERISRWFQPGAAPAVTKAAAPNMPPAAAPAIPNLPPIREPAPATLAASVPFTSEDIDSGRVPASGFGAFRNNRTGVVTNIGSAEAAPVRGAGTYQPQSPEAMFFGGAMRQKRAAAQETREMAVNKMLMDYGLKIPSMEKDIAQTANERLRTQAALEYGKMNPGAWDTMAAIASGRVQPRERVVAFPSLQPGGPVTYANTATLETTDVAPRARVRMQADDKGVLWIMKPDGRTPDRKATPAEIAQVKQQRGFGAAP